MVDKVGFATNPSDWSTVTLAAGNHLTDIVFTMQQGGVITGRVVNSAGEPLPNIGVVATLQRSAAARAGRLDAPRESGGGPGDQTDDRGEFRIHSLMPGTYVLRAMPERIDQEASPRQRMLVTTYFPSTTDSASSQTVSVNAGVTTADLLLQMIELNAYRVSGVVVDESGAPVANAVVKMIAPPGNRLLGSAAPSQVRTDPQGRFSIVNARSQAYTLLAVPPRIYQVTATGSWSSGVSDGRGGMISTEAKDGRMTEHRDTTGTQLPLVISEADVSGLQVVVHRLSPE
jgi:protocatechuate 3,4-dioxygenase beta subunit